MGGRGGGDRSVSVKDKTPKQVSKRQTGRQTEYIKHGGKGEEHLRQTQPSRGQGALECVAIRVAMPEGRGPQQKLFLKP